MKYEINLNNKKYIIEVADTKAIILEKTDNIASSSVDEDYVDVPDFDFSDGNQNVESSIRSPLFGTIIAVNVHNGDEVKKGDVLLVIESMKMENEVTAVRNCNVNEILVAVGSPVEKDQVLLTLNET